MQYCPSRRNTRFIPPSVTAIFIPCTAVVVEDTPLSAIATVYIGLVVNDAVAVLFTATGDGFVDAVRS